MIVKETVYSRFAVEQKFLPLNPTSAESTSRQPDAAAGAPASAQVAVESLLGDTRQDATLSSPTTPTPVYNLPPGVACSPAVEVVESRSRSQGNQHQEQYFDDQSALCVRCWTIHSTKIGGPFVSLTSAAAVGEATQRGETDNGGWKHRVLTNVLMAAIFGGGLWLASLS